MNTHFHWDTFVSLSGRRIHCTVRCTNKSFQKLDNGGLFLKGLNLSELFFHEHVASLVETICPSLAGNYAAGLIGFGSDVLGYDDEQSRDHEWGPRCIIWLKPEDYERYAAHIDLSSAGIRVPTDFHLVLLNSLLRMC